MGDLSVIDEYLGMVADVEFAPGDIVKFNGLLSGIQPGQTYEIPVTLVIKGREINA